jgi:citrate lyase beta subunit/adenine/guanine phosphoribosyltransferase-like PRPP-binding protein
VSDRLLDWTVLGLDSDPVPANTDVLVSIERDFRLMSAGAREANAGLNAVLFGAKKGGFKGATAEELGEETSVRLKRFIADVAASFDIAASAVFRYRTAVQWAQQLTSAALDSARGMASDDPGLWWLRDEVQQQREWLSREARDLERSLHDAADMVSQPIKVKSKLLAVLEEIALPVGAAVLGVVGIFTGGAIALIAFAANAALLAKTAADYGQGEGAWWLLALAVAGVLLPSTRGLGLSWARAPLQGALRAGSFALRGIEAGALAAGRLAVSPTKLVALMRSGVTVLPQWIAGSGPTAYRAIVSIEWVIGRTTSSVPVLINSADGFVKGAWNAGVTAVHSDFIQVTAKSAGMASKLWTYAVVNASRAFDLALVAVTPLSHSEITRLGYQGAFHMAFVERGLSMTATSAPELFGASARVGSAASEIDPGTAARVSEVPALGSAHTPVVVPGTPHGLGSAPTPGTVPERPTDGKPASGRLVELDPSLGMGRTDSGLLVPAGHAAAARAGGKPLRPGANGSPPHSLPHAQGCVGTVTDANDVPTARVGEFTTTPVPASGAGGRAGEVWEGVVDEAGARPDPGLPPSARSALRNSALDLLIGNRAEEGHAPGVGVGEVSKAAAAAASSGRSRSLKGLDSAGTPSAAATGQAAGKDGAGLDTAGQRSVSSSTSSSPSGFEPVGLHEAARLHAPGGPQRLGALPTERTGADVFDTTARPVGPDASYDGAPPHPPQQAGVEELLARDARWRVFRKVRDAEYTNCLAMWAEFKRHTGVLDSAFDVALRQFRNNDLFGGAHLGEDSPALRQVREDFRHDAEVAFEAGWKEAGDRLMPQETWQRQLDELHSGLGDRLALASARRRRMTAADSLLEEGLAQFRQHDLFGGSHLGDPTVVAEIQATEQALYANAVDTVWEQARSAGRPAPWRAGRLDAALDELRSALPERLAEAAGLQRYLKHGEREFDQALPAWEMDLVDMEPLSEKATARVREEFAESLRTAWRRPSEPERTSAFADVVAALPQRFEHAQFRQEQLERAQRALDSACHAYEHDMASGGRLSDGAPERLADEWTRAVESALDDHWFTAPGHIDFRQQPGAARRPVDVDDEPAGATSGEQVGTGADADSVTADEAVPARPSWNERFEQLKATLPHRLNHEAALPSVLERAADDFRHIAGHPRSAVRRYDITDEAFDALSGDFRRDTVTAYDHIRGPEGRDTEAWLRHEAGHENAFGTTLDPSRDAPSNENDATTPTPPADKPAAGTVQPTTVPAHEHTTPDFEAGQAVPDDVPASAGQARSRTAAPTLTRTEPTTPEPRELLEVRATDGRGPNTPRAHAGPPSTTSAATSRPVPWKTAEPARLGSTAEPSVAHPVTEQAPRVEGVHDAPTQVTVRRVQTYAVQATPSTSVTMLLPDPVAATTRRVTWHSPLPQPQNRQLAPGALLAQPAHRRPVRVALAVAAHRSVVVRSHYARHSVVVRSHYADHNGPCGRTLYVVSHGRAVWQAGQAPATSGHSQVLWTAGAGTPSPHSAEETAELSASSPRTLVASDLDHTLIYPAGALHLTMPDQDAPRLLCVEIYQGRPLSYLTETSGRLLDQLSTAAEFVPATTRTREQYQRIHLPGPLPRFAICANGGHILLDGHTDRNWNAEMCRRVADGAAPLADIRDYLARTADPAWLLSERVAEDLFAYLVVEQSLLPEGWVKDLTGWAGERGWTISVQGRKIYAVPEPLTKSAALAEIKRRTGADRVLAAGDSLLDAELLLAADAGWRPGHGELADTDWSAPHVTGLATSGVAAGEEILRHMLAATGATPTAAQHPWSGQWVADRLGIALHGDGLTGLTGLALRRNPKRAHLLVSTVLGKHIPQRPHVVYEAGHGLGCRVLALLGEAAAARAVVLGYAETATALGHAVADGLGLAPYLHSTRRHVAGVQPVGSFQEEHSHHTSHLLLPEDPQLFAGGGPLVVVDDELSTGNTVLNTIRVLHSTSPRDHYVLVALADLRSPGDRARLEALAADLGARLDVVAQATGTVTLPDGVLERARALVAQHKEQAAQVQRVDLGWPDGLPDGGRHGFTPGHRERLQAALPHMARRVAAALPADVRRVLVLGSEELMYAPLRLAAELDQTVGAEVRFSATTRSPVVAVDDPGYAIRTRIVFPSHDQSHDQPADGTGERYAYNVAGGGFDAILAVVDSAGDTPALHAPGGLLAQLAAHTGHVLLATVPARLPLVRPQESQPERADLVRAGDVGSVPLVLPPRTTGSGTRHFGHLSPQVRQTLFHLEPQEFTADSPADILSVALGATLYSPATRPGLADDVVKQAARGVRSMVLCLEDSIADHEVEAAEDNLVRQFSDLEPRLAGGDPPLLFIRVRTPGQITDLVRRLGENIRLLCGFVVPKFTEETGIPFLEALTDAEASCGRRLFAMPVLETPDLLGLESRTETLRGVARAVGTYRDRVLAIRLGVTDLCSVYGLRRAPDTTAYDVQIVASVITDVVNVLGRADGTGFTITGPVWEYFPHTEGMSEKPLRRGLLVPQTVRLRQTLSQHGLLREIRLDRANGLLGKTCIHPSHVAPIQAFSVVSHEDYRDALAILDPDSSGGGILRSAYANKMNEVKPHRAWAERTLRRAKVFGVAREGVGFVDLLAATCEDVGFVDLPTPPSSSAPVSGVMPDPAADNIHQTTARDQAGEHLRDEGQPEPSHGFPVAGPRARGAGPSISESAGPSQHARAAAALCEPLRGPDFSSYAPDEVVWLLKDLSDVKLEASVEEREEAVQSGGAHYAESLPVEYQPSAEYQALFRTALTSSADRMARSVGAVTELVLAERGRDVVLVSLARAGVPVGVLMRRWAHHAHGLDLPHYAVSIVRGRGLDANAMRWLTRHHDPAKVVFVDGWTGKGAITRELAEAVKPFGGFDPEIAVLADPGSCVRTYGTRDDFLIPSACLNSTVSGLVSRTVLRDDLIGPDDFHGAKFYRHLAHADVSGLFLDTISTRFAAVADQVTADVMALRAVDRTPTWTGLAAVERISAEYGIGDVNLVKPGVGETTRVLLRRVPWRVLVRRGAGSDLDHIRLLAEQRGVPVEEVDDLPYSCVGLIHPHYTRAATGATGTAVQDTEPGGRNPDEPKLSTLTPQQAEAKARELADSLRNACGDPSADLVAELETYADDPCFAGMLAKNVPPQEMATLIAVTSSVFRHAPSERTYEQSQDLRNRYERLLKALSAAVATATRQIGADLKLPGDYAGQWVETITESSDPRSPGTAALILRNGVYGKDFLSALGTGVLDCEHRENRDRMWRSTAPSTTGTVTGPDGEAYDDAMAGIMEAFGNNPDAGQVWLDEDRLTYLIQERRWPTDDGEGLGNAIEAATTVHRDRGPRGERSAALASLSFKLIGERVDSGRSEGFWGFGAHQGWQVPAGMRESVGRMLARYMPDVYRVAAGGSDGEVPGVFKGRDDGMPPNYPYGARINQDQLAKVLQSIGADRDALGWVAAGALQMQAHVMEWTLGEALRRDPEAAEKFLAGQSLDLVDQNGDRSAAVIGFLLKHGIDGNTADENARKKLREQFVNLFMAAVVFVPTPRGKFAGHVLNRAKRMLYADLMKLGDISAASWGRDQHELVRAALEQQAYNLLLNAGYLGGATKPPDPITVKEGDRLRLKTPEELERDGATEQYQNWYNNHAPKSWVNEHVLTPYQRAYPAMFGN